MFVIFQWKCLGPFITNTFNYKRRHKNIWHQQRHWSREKFCKAMNNSLFWQENAGCINTVLAIPSGTRKKSLPIQYEWIDSGSGNVRFKRGHQWKERHFWMVIRSHIRDTAASSLTEIWSKNLVVLQPETHWINTQIEQVGCVSETLKCVDF